MTAAAHVTVVIADDEPIARAGLRAMLSTFKWLTIVGEAANGAAALEMIDRLAPGELVSGTDNEKFAAPWRLARSDSYARVA